MTGGPPRRGGGTEAAPAPASGPAPGTLGAVVVNYRAADHVLGCVASLRADGVEDIVVVDNDSGDGCRAALERADPGARFVAMDANHGYGAAANRGVREIDAEVVLVCNPDLIVHPGLASALLEAMRKPGVGAAGPRIDRPDGSRYPSARAFPSMIDAAGHGFVGLVSDRNRFSRRYLRTDAEGPGPVDWISGACMAVRREAFEAVGGFDEAYFMFMEDVDLCWRLGRAGWRTVYEPAARVTHLEGVSREAAPYRMIVAHHRSLLRYAWRTTSGNDRWWLPVVAVGLVVRAALMCARRAMNPRRRSDNSPRLV